MDEKQLKERKELLLSLMNEKTYVPMKLKELAILLDIPKSGREELKEVLDELVREGKAGISKKGKYGKADISAVTGIFSANPRGFGFVSAEGFDSDFFVAPDNTGSAMDGDTVRIVTEEPADGKRAEATVIKVVKRAHETLVGMYEKSRGFGFVIPDNPRITCDIFIPEGKQNGAVSGHKVVVRLTSFGGGKKNPEGEVEEILGHIHDPGVDILSVCRAYGLPEGFPEAVMEDAGTVPEEVTDAAAGKELRQGRLDLRHIPMVTIDGEDARDLDDAVSMSVDMIGGKPVYHLGVHIADVSHYVKEGSPLDAEARQRGTSVYLTDRVIPMLPHRLSNGICSLNEGCDRLALSCLMDLDEKGNVTGHKICETLIRVNKRMTYTGVQAVLEQGENAGGENVACPEGYETFVPMLLLMKEAAELLRKKRKARGAVDFDFAECRILLDEKGKPVDIVPRQRNDATRLIEDFMLAANETVAEEYYWQQIPFLYRTHEKPDPEKIRAFSLMIGSFGYSVRLQNGELHPKELQKLLGRAEGTPEEALISRMALRSMKQARYSTECDGHFGLAAAYYTHFTSPIRRYPDLQIHRIIKENLHGELGKKRLAHYEKILGETAAWASFRERLAEEAERETDRMKKVEFMEKHIGETFEGVISGVSGYGFYVELPNTVEGMVRVGDLDDDYYVYREERCELVGERTGKTYKLGQKIRVWVTGADRYLKTIDFLPVRNF